MSAPGFAASPAMSLFGPADAPPDRIRLRRLPHRPAVVGAAPHPDKAVSQRATIIAAVADGTSRITSLADCRDVRANLEALTALGTVIRPAGPAAVDIVGRSQSDIRAAGLTLDAGNSATTSRLLLALVAGSAGDGTITGNESLRSRPMESVIAPLRALGADVTELDRPGRLPVRVRGTRLRGGPVQMIGDSAQPVSALLLAGLAADGPVRIGRRTAARDHTERLLRWTGIDITESPAELVLTPGRPRAFDLVVPGDPSAAALLIALHLAVAESGEQLVVRGVGYNHRRIGFLRVVTAMGVPVSAAPLGPAGPEPLADLTITAPNRLHGTTIGGRELVQSCIDELPLAAALATTAEGPTLIADAGELRDKDTDRIAGTVDLLAAFGARAQATADGLLIEPGPLVAPPVVVLPPDHRIVFAAFVLSLLAGGTTELRGVSAAATSHPGALLDLRRVARVECS